MPGKEIKGTSKIANYRHGGRTGFKHGSSNPLEPKSVDGKKGKQKIIYEEQRTPQTPLHLQPMYQRKKKIKVKLAGTDEANRPIKRPTKEEVTKG